ncbi:MAG TPA: hypothetical protein VFB37_12680 [Steroidobacteraceae bacterium]|nr:hypothetical protein [Steroidobacteraceae bacterium]
MNRLVCTTVLSLLAAPAFAADVGVSISVGQPGFFGQINIGAIPPPPVVYAQPVVAVRSPEYVAVEPIYLHVPPGHERHWSRHCAEYHACGRPVYFVRDEWYNKEYVPRYAREHRDHEDVHGRGHGHDDDHGHGHERRDDDHGRGHGDHDDDHGHGDR